LDVKRYCHHGTCVLAYSDAAEKKFHCFHILTSKIH
jgi:hypothetical protein